MMHLIIIFNKQTKRPLICIDCGNLEDNCDCDDE